jgi:outer membrane protein OmpA-like peptidoglycan-associated protein
MTIDVEAVYFQPLPEFFDYGKCRTHSGVKCFKMEGTDYFGDAKRGDPAALALAGVAYRATPDVSLSLGGGLGLLGARKEDFRLMSGIIWQPSPAGSRVIGRGDSDGDGSPDAIDICVDEPEDNDGFQDDDGCPDLDNDGDGIIDASDGCADEPEDKDGHQDDDGCPERDNDGDKVEDVVDRCPLDKEDMDSFEDDDGCPDEDNDGDGFPDGKDRCPNDRETINGIDDGDGCPDARTGGPQMEADSIDLQGSRIAFVGAKRDQLNKASTTLLDQVADLLKQPGNQSKIISIESHTNLSTASGNANQIRQARARDLDLTRRRAKAVYDYLVGKGIPAGALRMNPLGSTAPLRQPATDPINDRIEFSRI